VGSRKPSPGENSPEQLEAKRAFLEERAALREFMGGQSRTEAEFNALMDWERFNLPPWWRAFRPDSK
jgi:hypothetical protein